MKKDQTKTEEEIEERECYREKEPQLLCPYH